MADIRDLQEAILDTNIQLADLTIAAVDEYQILQTKALVSVIRESSMRLEIAIREAAGRG